MGRAFEYRKAAKFARWDRMAKQFSRIGKEIALAVKDGGSNPETNLALRRAIINAKGVNMPKDNVERAIKKAAGADAENWEEISFEGYAPNGIGVFVECTTNNNNRSVANIRAIFNKVGGSLGKNGELAFIFLRKGVFTIPKDRVEMEWDDFELEMIDGGAEDIEQEDENITIYTALEDFGNLSQKLDELKIEAKNSELQRIPTTTKELPLEQAEGILEIIDRFEQDDDVQNVFHNLKITKELEDSLKDS